MPDALPTLEKLADGSGYRTRVRFGTRQQRRFRILNTDEVQAGRTAVELVALGATIGKAKLDPELGARLLTMAGAGELARVKTTVAKLAAGTRVQKKDAPRPGTITTMAQLGAAWTSGELAAKYPDHVKTKRTKDKDKQRFDLMAKTIGHVSVKAFALADAELVMAALPKGLASATRRQYAQILGKLCNIAVYPLKLIPVSPLPRGFLPKVKRTKATAWLYPSEDAQLLACTKVPLGRRLLYGFLAREGLRCGEALSLRWSDLDLTLGVVKLDRNKTDDPRVWAMAPGVAKALKRYQKTATTDQVFNTLNEDHLAEAFRRDLEFAEIDRPELFERSKTRQPIRLHDLRATFVTLALAAGKSEAWVSARPGHRSSVMIANYRRGARTAAELELGELAALDGAIAWEYTAPTNAGHYSAANPPPRKKRL